MTNEKEQDQEGKTHEKGSVAQFILTMSVFVILWQQKAALYWTESVFVMVTVFLFSVQSPHVDTFCINNQQSV